jgi:hypothetical protein
LRGQIKDEMTGKEAFELETMKEDMITEKTEMEAQKVELQDQIRSTYAQFKREDESMTLTIGQLERCRTLKSIYEKNKTEVKDQLTVIGTKLGWTIDSPALFEKKGIDEAVDNLQDTLQHIQQKKSKSVDRFEKSLEDQHQSINR